MAEGIEGAVAGDRDLELAVEPRVGHDDRDAVREPTPQQRYEQAVGLPGGNGRPAGREREYSSAVAGS